MIASQTVNTYGSWFPVRVPGAEDALAEATAPATLDTRCTLGVISDRRGPLNLYGSVLVQPFVLVLLVRPVAPTNRQ